MTSKVQKFLKFVSESEETRDPAKSKATHEAKMRGAKSKEDHKSGADYIKGIVYGGLDGAITSFAVVAAIIGSKLSAEVIIVLGFGKLIGDALSMGLGDYVSSKSEVEFALSEKQRETWECDNYLEGEKKEMVELYVKRGMTETAATELIDIFAKYKTSFVDMMMIEELGMLPPDENASIWKPALVTFLSFVAAGIIPLVPFVIAAIAKTTINGPSSLYFIFCVIITILLLFGLGAWTSRFSVARWFWAGAQMAIIGGAAAAISYGVGALGGSILKAEVPSPTAPSPGPIPTAPFVVSPFAAPVASPI